ncbi:putative F420-0 ABC transporter substrate-binding protein [Marisediminicola senii]|uniref:putative F420-0 ABC transporter substrate-binding protein n=1 Tax=Marisediminicola senii TaxID=2711233 RepID=UPI0013EA07E6|nr:putative F420-0 ABC transporter substrate-binding protein [Marisediminicola senii]
MPSPQGPARPRLAHTARTTGLGALAVLAVALTGCAATPAAAPETGEGSDAAASAPSQLDNCGTVVEVPEAAPERIVTIKSTTTEMLLALGLGDRIVGSAFQDGPVLEQWAGAAEDIPVISDFAPSQEAVLELEPDFVYVGWESMLTPESAGDRESLAALGIGSYVAPSACKGEGYQPAKLAFDDVFAEITEAGTLFGAPDAAAELIADQQAQLDTIDADERGLTALWYSSGTDIPYVGAGIGAPQMMLEALGLSNVAADIDDTWSSLGWEAIVDQDPDVIVLVDASWNTAASKIELLESNPATAELDAVQNQRYLTVPFPAGEAGVRSVPATADLAEQLAAMDLEG